MATSEIINIYLRPFVFLLKHHLLISLRRSTIRFALTSGSNIEGTYDKQRNRTMAEARERIRVGNLNVAKILYDFVNVEVLPGTNTDRETFWSGAESILAELAPENRRLLQRRADLQAQIDQWHRAHPGGDMDIAAYTSFLYQIGYLLPCDHEAPCILNTSNVDDEVARQAGPQLVVPLMNPRFVLNAANARWGSLYDALYGTDAVSEHDGCERTRAYNPKRGEHVIAYARKFLDQYFPLSHGASHTDAVRYSIDAMQLQVRKRISIVCAARS